MLRIVVVLFVMRDLRLRFWDNYGIDGEMGG
jgi:hypothetical protein